MFTMFKDDEKQEKSIREAIREADRDPVGHLSEDTPDEPGKPEAVNLERQEPITNAARRRVEPERHGRTAVGGERDGFIRDKRDEH